MLLSIAISRPTLAQEKLPLLIKRIEPAIITIIANDEKGEFLQQGSGFFIGKDGELITNRHVLSGAAGAKIQFSDGKQFSITAVVAEDINGDLIEVLTDAPKNLIKHLPICASAPQAGEQVIVMGSPFSLEQTVTNGIISAIRELPERGNILQITAAISPGSSGSPVVNYKGEVVGVATLQASQGQSLNFAIPAHRIISLQRQERRTLTEWLEKSKNSPDKFNNDVAEGIKNGLAATPQEWLKISADYSRQGKLEDALTAGQQALKLDPQYAAAHYDLGIIYGRMGRFQAAVESFQQAIQLKMDDARCRFNLGVAYSKLNNWQDAIGQFRQAIEMDPKYLSARFNLGLSYSELGRYQEAVATFKEALNLQPDSAEIYSNLGTVYGKMADLPAAIAAFQQAIKIDHSFEAAYVNLGKACAQLGRFQESQDALKQAIKIDPDDDVAHYGLGLAYLELGDKSAALEEYKILKKLNPELAEKLFARIY